MYRRLSLFLAAVSFFELGSGGAVIGPHPGVFDVSGTDGYRRCVRVNLKSYNDFHWNATHSNLLAGVVSEGLRLTDRWVISLGETPWEGTDLLRYHPGEKVPYDTAVGICEGLGSWLHDGNDCEECWGSKTELGGCRLTNGEISPCDSSQLFTCERHEDGQGELSLQVQLRSEAHPEMAAPVFTSSDESDFTEILVSILQSGISSINKPLVAYKSPAVTCFHNPPLNYYVKRMRFVVESDIGAVLDERAQVQFIRILQTLWKWEVLLQVFDRNSDTIILASLTAPDSADREEVAKAASNIDTILTPAYCNNKLHEDEHQVTQVIIGLADVENPAQQDKEDNTSQKLFIPGMALIGVSVVSAVVVLRQAYINSEEDSEKDEVGVPVVPGQDFLNASNPGGSTVTDALSIEDIVEAATELRSLSPRERNPVTIPVTARQESVSTTHRTPPLPPSAATLERLEEQEQQNSNLLSVMAQMGINPLCSETARRVFPETEEQHHRRPPRLLLKKKSKFDQAA